MTLIKKVLTFSAFILSAVSNANEPIRIAVIDTGLNLQDPRFKNYLCDSGHYDATGTTIVDREGHGTHIAGLITQNAGNANYCLIIIKAFDVKYDLKIYLRGLKRAVMLKPDIINISAGGLELNRKESELIYFNPNITFIVAAGNDGKNLDIKSNSYYPASYPFENITTVGSMKNNVLSYFSNYGKIVDVYENGENVTSTLPDSTNGVMSGTSQATAIHTGKYVKALYSLH